MYMGKRLHIVIDTWDADTPTLSPFLSFSSAALLVDELAKVDETDVEVSTSVEVFDGDYWDLVIYFRRGKREVKIVESQEVDI